MKKMKIVSGLMALAMTAMAVGSVASAADAVKISVGEDTIALSDTFSVDVAFASVPTAGLSSIDFAIDYDDAVIDVEKVELGAIGNTGAAASEGDLSSTLFNWYDTGDQIVLVWATGLDDASKWVKSDGVFVTLSGKAASGAKDGDSTKLKVSPVARESFPGSGTNNSSVVLAGVGASETVNYTFSATDGSVTLGSAAQTKFGDVDCSGVVDIGDVILLNRFCAEDANAKVTAQGMKNADCVADGTINTEDAVLIMKYLAKIVPLSDLGKA